MKRFLYLAFLLSAFTVPACASWNNMPVTGSATYWGGSDLGFYFSGSTNLHSVMASSGTLDAPSSWMCPQKQLCQIDLPASGLYWGLGFSGGQVDGVWADFLLGGLSLTFIAPVLPTEYSETTVVGGTSGAVTGYACLDYNDCWDYHAPVWSLSVAGHGKVQIRGWGDGYGNDYISLADLTFKGSVPVWTPVPEPLSLSMLGSGVLVLSGLKMLLK